MNNRPFIKNLIWNANLDEASKTLIKNKIHSFDNLDGYETENINTVYIQKNEDIFDFIKKNPFQKTDIIFLRPKKAKDFYNLLQNQSYTIIPRIFIVDKEVIELTNEYSDLIDIPFFHKKYIYPSIKRLLSDLCKKDTYKSNTIPSIEINEDNLFSFEYVDTNKLSFPLYIRTLIKQPTNEEIEKFNKFCRDKDFAKNNKNNNSIINPRKKEEYKDKEDLRYLLEQIERVERLKIIIPFPILIKFWLRIYTYHTNFYREINYILKKNSNSIYGIYVRGLYHGRKYIDFDIKHTLYRGSNISNKELKQLKEYLKNKKDSKICHCYSKSFFSCSLDKEIAIKFMYNYKPDLKQNSYVLYIVENGCKDDIENVSNADLSKISFYDEAEILFYPFSSFEVIDIKEINKEVSIKKVRGKDIEILNADIKYYEIRLNYIGKYKKKVPKPDKLNRIEESSYANCLLKTNILKKKELDQALFEFDIKKYLNTISCKYTIPKEMKNKPIKLINFDNKDNSCQISINNNDTFNFQSEYTFKEEGEYKIDFDFNKLLRNTSSLFENCKYLTSVDLSNLNSKELELMINMFNNCINLKEFIFNNSDTKSIKNMNGMFYKCESLKSIDLSNLNLENAFDISSMFRYCKSLQNVKFFKSDTVKSMDYLFDNCSSLINLDLSEFDCKNADEIGHVFGGSFNKQCNIKYKKDSKFKLIDPKFSTII